MKIAELARSLFPRGYLTYDLYRNQVRAAQAGKRQPKGPSSLDLRMPPLLPADVFAVVGLLMLRSGAYHHVTPQITGMVSPRTLLVSETDRRHWKESGAEWRGDGKGMLQPPPSSVQEAWTSLWIDQAKPVYRAVRSGERPPDWWRHALALLCMADEAAKSVGFQSRTKSAYAASVEAAMRSRIRKGGKISTLSQADPDVLCVLPKSRTARVGCTLRSLSHHLALLPSRGLARAYWVPAAKGSGSRPHKPAESFNFLVVPWPYRVRATAFTAVEADEENWGWFEVAPHWCPSTDHEALEKGLPYALEFLDKLLDDAAADVGVIHGLVLPEMALSHGAFTGIADHLAKRKDFELLVSGLFDVKQGDTELRKGNFAAMAQFEPSDSEDGYSVSVREKHHRWRLDRAQIETYALGASLDANRGWWERIDILSRSLDVLTLRGQATVTALICEDLARHDPCQELIRGIGPNLVFALLMDSAQIKERWPGRYATVLADDPGSSVLTLTSLGLIRRANETGLFNGSQKIGLWRDDTGKTVELELPPNAHGLCLTVQPSPKKEHTLDGRSDESAAQSWRLTGVRPVRTDLNSSILQGDWPAPTT